MSVNPPLAGPSGAGYAYPDTGPTADLDTYTRLSGRYLRRAGSDALHFVAGAINAWSWTPTGVVTLVESLPARSRLYSRRRVLPAAPSVDLTSLRCE